MDILFAVLPFANVAYPALGVSLLKAHAQRRGLSAVVRYFNIDLAERMDLDLYGWFAQLDDNKGLASPAAFESLVGEWFFSDVVFPDRSSVEDEYVKTFLATDPGIRGLIPEIRKARAHRRDFVERCVEEIRRQAPRVVGFTTTFHQTCACLAVARRLKEGSHPPIILFGGANCEGEMGLQLIRSFPWIDYVCTGEGDEAAPAFLERLLRHGDPRPVPGILKQGVSQSLTHPARVHEMDSLPIPDYSDYFERLRDSTIGARLSPRLMIETARGCWWGEKHHCTFCGLNGETMTYRSKSPERVVQELRYLSETYGVSRVDCVDNILDLRYLPTVFPELIRNGPKLELFYETKANLRFDQLHTLREGGVRSIQPGIESFSNQVLRLMRKGCTGLQNIQLLRWCEELGIGVGWNILYGFPGESPSEYERMARLIPLLAHLQPPGYCGHVRLDRFSPLFVGREESGLTGVRPMSSYSYVFPLEDEDLRRLAYFFEFDYVDRRDPRSYTGELMREARLWAERNQDPSRLDLLQAGPVAIITDTRTCAVKPTHVVSGLAAKAYLACDVIQTPASLARKLGQSLSEPEARALLEPFLAGRLMVEMDGHYLSLAVLRNRATREEDAGDGAPVERRPSTPIPLRAV